MHSGVSETAKKHRFSSLSVVAVQSLSCAVVLLAVLTLRLVGGGLFQELNRYFHEALRQNTLTTAIAALWDGEMPFEEVSQEDV